MDNQEWVQRGTSTRSPARLLFVLIGVAAIVALVVWKVVLPFVTVEQKEELPHEASDLYPACIFPGVAYVTAAAYKGPAPHPVKLPEVYSDSDKMKELTSAWLPDSALKVQLIACADRVSRRGDRQKDCKYRRSLGLLGVVPFPDEIPMYQGTYDVTLYELRTHRKVAHTTLIGSDDECPSGVSFAPREDHELYTRLSPSQYVEAFSIYVEK